MFKISSNPSPIELGLPKEFEFWYAHQWETIESLSESTKRTKILCAPTGSGKTGVCIGYARYNNKRFCYVTPSIKLQDQLSNKFTDVPAFKGRDNYECINIASPTETCHGAPCTDGHDCQHRYNDCLYDIAERTARKSDHGFVTTYGKWGTLIDPKYKYHDRVGKLDLIIFDEGHKIDGWMKQFTAVDLACELVSRYLATELPIGSGSQFLQVWASEAIKLARVAYSQAVLKDDKENIEYIGRQLLLLSTPDIQWVIDSSNTQRLQAWPLWPDQFIERYLLSGISDVIICSATLTEKSVRRLGITDCSFHVMPSTFPPERRPFIYLDKEPYVKLNYKSTPQEKQILYNRLTEALKLYSGYNTVVHTVSHKRTNECRQSISVNNGTSQIIDDVDMFKDKANWPAVLLSASISEGVDFPDDECRLVWIAKVPFPDIRDLLIAARMKADYGYYLSLVAEELMQMAGRAVRHCNDWAVCVCPDDKVVDVLNDATNFQNWFLESVVHPFPSSIPSPEEMNQLTAKGAIDESHSN